jgi:hypothetical protein
VQADITVAGDGPRHVQRQRHSGDRGPGRESGGDVEGDQAPANIGASGLSGEEPLPNTIVALFLVLRLIESVVFAGAQRFIERDIYGGAGRF